MSNIVRKIRCQTQAERTKPPEPIHPNRIKTQSSTIKAPPHTEFRISHYEPTKTKSHRLFQQPHLITFVRHKQPHNHITTTQPDPPPQPPKYTLHKPIAHSAHSTVYLAHSLTQHQLAIKRIVQHRTHPSRQLSILKQLKHPAILQLIDHYSTAEKDLQYLHLVTHYYPTDLHRLILHKHLPCTLIPLYLLQILQGLAYLNDKDIMHRDLTPMNILVDTQTHRVVIADFGSAKQANYASNSHPDVCTRTYRAPELIFGSKQYSTSIDMWSFACIAAEMVTGTPLFHSHTNVEQLMQIIKLLGTPSQEQTASMNPDFSIKEYQSLPKLKPKQLKQIINTSDTLLIDLLSKIILYTPEKRLTPEQAIQHKYFQPLSNQQYYKLHNIDPLAFGITHQKHDLKTQHQSNLNTFNKSPPSPYEHKRTQTTISKIDSETTASKMDSRIRDPPRLRPRPVRRLHF